MPDWRNLDDYQYTKGLTHKAWAWEFLRRNPDYRNAWQVWKHDEKLRTPTPLELLTSEEIEVTQSIGNKHREEAVREAGKWGLLMPCDPNVRADTFQTEEGDFIWWRRDLLSASVFVLNKDHARETLRRLSLETELLAFDLRRPINQQLDQARILLRQLREFKEIKQRRVNTKAHKKLWPRYLQALDARNDGRPLKEIAVVFFENVSMTSKAGDFLKQAERLRDGGYRKIVALE